jgi:hypothetical protein
VLEARSQGLEGAHPAILAAGRWARQFLISKRGFEAAVSEASSEPVELIRVRWRGRTRRVIVRQTFTESRVRNVQEPLDPRSFDPWSESSESLTAKTLQLSRCRTCGGEKTVLCGTCGGSAVILCELCKGSGFTWSPRSRRMIGCRVCRKSGKRICSCRDGRVSCGPCGGKGKVEEWLEVAEESFDRVTFAGSDVLAQALSGHADPDKLDSDLVRYPVPLVFSWRGRAIEEAPSELRNVLRRSDLVGTNPGEDRLQEVVVQVFRSEITTVVYQIGGVSGSVQVQEWDHRVNENTSSRQPFQLRRHRTVQGMSIAFVAGSALAIWYGGRHSFFVSTPNYWLLWISAVILGLCFIPLMLWLAIPAGRRRWKGAIAASLPALLVVLAQTGLAATGGPSLEHARAAATRGQLEEAVRESAACFDLGIDAEPAGLFHDQLQLEKVRQAREPQKAWEAASLPFLTKAGREQAQAHAVEVTLQTSTALQERGELSASAALLDSAPAEIKQIGPLVGLRRRVYLEEARPLWKVIESRRKSLEDRLTACTAIIPHVKGLATLPTIPGDSSLTEEEVEAECERLREQCRRDIERQEVAEAREAERARRREEAAQESALRRWSSAPLLCNDGTQSPSCVCGGSHRGCCSHHGGVAGCSAP